MNGREEGCRLAARGGGLSLHPSTARRPDGILPAGAEWYSLPDVRLRSVCAFKINPRSFLCSSLLLGAVCVVSAQNFRWDWHASQELIGTESLRNANWLQHDKSAMAAAIAAELRPAAFDDPINSIKSEDQLRDAVLNTRIKRIDLNHDGIPEVVAQAMVDCSPTGNCPFWIFHKTARRYESILSGFGQTFTIQESRTRGFNDIVVGMHGSAFEQTLEVYQFKDGRYRRTACYDATWQVLEGENTRELKEPLITPCGGG